MNNTDQQPRIVNHNEMHDCNVFMGDSYGGIFPLPGAQVTINQQLGPQKRNTSIEGKTEPIEQRQSRKEEAISAICKHLDVCYGGCPVLWKNFSFASLKEFKAKRINELSHSTE